MKKCISISNNQPSDKGRMKNLTSNTYLKPAFFGKFINETLFYIFYFMARDSLQICAAEELYKRKWRYHTEYCVWFIPEESDKIIEGNYNYFNYNEWKVMKYIYASVNVKMFLADSEVLKYFKALNIDK
jgi:CCR4-NOT transcriptional regulation complex NOT5 subunit